MCEHILIIDDEDHIRSMMRLTLEAVHHVVGEARDGLEGLKVYGNGSQWDVVVLDQRMPGIDGLETLRSAVAAALSRPSAQSPANALPVETVTMNGFSILDPENTEWQLPEERRFT